MRMFAVIVLFLGTFGFPGPAQAKLPAHKFYEGCKAAIESNDFQKSACNYYIEGILQGVRITGIYMAPLLDPVIKNDQDFAKRSRFPQIVCSELYSKKSYRELARGYVDYVDAKLQNGTDIQNYPAEKSLLEFFADNICASNKIK